MFISGPFVMPFQIPRSLVHINPMLVLIFDMILANIDTNRPFIHYSILSKISPKMIRYLYINSYE